MKKLAVIIKHPFRGESDYRVDIYEVPDEFEKEEMYKYAMSQMLGPFEIISISDRISFDCRVNKLPFNTGVK